MRNKQDSVRIFRKGKSPVRKVSTDNVDALFADAFALHQSGRLNEAKTIYLRVLEMTPANPQALGNLGSLLRRQGSLAEALKFLERACAADSSNPTHFFNYGNALRSAGRYAEAATSYGQSLKKNPNDPNAWYNYGVTCQDLGRAVDAINAYKSVLKIMPHHFDARLNLAVVLINRGMVSAAEEQLEKIPADSAQYVSALTNLAKMRQDVSDHAAAIQLLETLAKMTPELSAVKTNLLLAQQYVLSTTVPQVLEAATTWGNWAQARAGGELPRPPMAAAKPGRPLRVGYVSGDLCAHPVGLFLKDVLASHTREAVQPVVYCNNTVHDEVTRALHASVSSLTGPGGWRNVSALDDAALAAQVRADQIDILIDLSGHTAGSRLPMFAFRPAPVQISWLGYFATTGLRTIDYVILDPWHAPPGTEEQFSERILRLPHNRFCYTAVPFAPDVALPPMARNGYVTFGSFNNTAKLNETVLATWARILSEVPMSRLLLKWRTFADMPYCDRIRVFFSSRGIAPARIELRAASSHRALLEEYADIDIALDPYPFAGGHTSCEALWMGVPVVTWPQGRVVSRQTYSFLANIGMAELAAESEEEYIRIACELAADKARLRHIRDTLRERVVMSSLCDRLRFVRDLEEILRSAWEQIANEERAARMAAAAGLHARALDAWGREEIDEALAFLELAIVKNPNVASFHAHLGVMLKRRGEVVKRIACYRRAIELDPHEPTYSANLAAALNEAGDHAGAESAARAALLLDPRRPETLYNLGSSLLAQARHAEAAEAFSAAAEQRSNWLEAEARAADAWRLIGAWKQAEQHYRAALVCLPDDMSLLSSLGNILKAQDQLDAAEAQYLRMLELDAGSAVGHANLGTIAQAKGDIETAIECYRRALELDPGQGQVWVNLANALTYSPAHTPAEVLTCYRALDRQFARHLLDMRPHPNDRSADRRLKIGYVSPDFRKHAVAYFALPLIEGHCSDEVEVYCYYNHRQDDEWTAAFREAADHWRNCIEMGDSDLAEQIRADQIDILVDLAGHTENNRLLVFARKPAPVQVTWMGYVTTTGLRAMDWRVTHEDADPAGSEIDYSEKLFRLAGSMWCYRPLPGMPEVTSAPSLAKGYVTFASLNRYSKNSAIVLEAWSQILRRVPSSRLVICIPEGGGRRRMMRFFGEQGIAPERISAFSKLSHQDFWKLHGEVDIALDPFPFGGGTTTCETLWLGVPVISVAGKADGDFAPRFASRMGLAFLRSIGMPELASESISGYVDAAVNLASDPLRLNDLRYTLRDKMSRAALTDAPRFVAEMEAAYRTMWRVWVDQASASGQI